MEHKEDLKRAIRNFLDVPRKARAGDENGDIERKLGDFLVERERIKGVGERSEDWGFVYYSITCKIFVSEKEMPHNKWEDCIFKMGVNTETGESLFPEPGAETDKYRFLHEANHAYQDYLCSKESPKEPALFYQKCLNNEIVSSYADLFRFCFRKRKEEKISNKEGSPVKGLSVWGNAPNYKHQGNEGIPNEDSEIAIRAQEDANELVTMFLWHPEYFNMYLAYISLDHDNFKVREKELTKEDLERKGLIKLSKEEAALLKKMVDSYVREMKEDLG